MRFTREQYLDLMTFGEAERPMFVELFGPLIGLEDEWRAQGATPQELDLSAFEWDYVEIAGCGAATGLWGGLEPVVLEETAEHVIRRDELGRTMKLLKGFATIPLPMDHPVATFDDWLRIKPGFMFREERIDPARIERARREQARGAVVTASIPGAFDLPRQLMGEERACLAYYDQPELMHDILGTLRETSLRVLERVTDRLTIDQLGVHEDLAGKSGPLVGPAQIEEFIRPYFADVWDLMSSRGTRLFCMDSDGDVTPVLDAFCACGLNAMYPMEPAAGVDVVAVRERFGARLAMKGGIDKFVLRRGRDAIRRELGYKMQPRMREGGMVFGLDHRIPNGTPLDGYRSYVELGREILGLPPLTGRGSPWRRMAF